VLGIEGDHVQDLCEVESLLEVEGGNGRAVAGQFVQLFLALAHLDLDGLSVLRCFNRRFYDCSADKVNGFYPGSILEKEDDVVFQDSSFLACAI
jgi:hypothetical protein